MGRRRRCRGGVLVVALALCLLQLSLALPASAADDGGRIEARWQATGADAGPLGAPLADPVDVADGRSRDFTGGSIYWSPATDAWEVLPPVRDRYLELGGPGGLLGFPAGVAAPLDPTVGDEAAAGVEGAAEQVFAGGRLYVWREGVFAVSGAILKRYLRLGASASYLGLPRTDTVAVKGGFRTLFERGRIRWDAATGATLVTGRWTPAVRRVTAAEIPYTYRVGCPVRPSRLRWVRMPHYDWDGVPRWGDLVIRSTAVGDVQRVFARAFAARFPIRRMKPADAYDGVDERAMAADNTSAFNCRKVTGNPYRLSQHSYGNAIDINTRENPYLTSSRVYPPSGRPFLNRSDGRKGMILRSGPIAKAMAAEGWLWGARWSHPDYQHFSSNGG